MLYSNLAYDTVRDFAPIARLASIENVMLVQIIKSAGIKKDAL